MKDLDTIAHEIFETSFGSPALYEAEYEAVEKIKSALAAYSDECAKQMRDQCADICNLADNFGSRNEYSTAKTAGDCEYEIRAIPLPSERGK